MSKSILALLSESYYSDYSKTEIKQAALENLSKHEIAQALSGTANRIDKKYQSSYRQAGLYKQNLRSPGAQSSEKLRKTLVERQTFSKRGPKRDIRVEFHGYVIVSSDRRLRFITVDLDVYQIELILTHKSEEEAIEEMLFQYGINGAAAYDYNVEVK